MPRVHSYPEGHWRMRTDIPYSMGVMQNDLFFLCGQADLSGDGDVQNPGDLHAQTRSSVRHIRAVVQDLGCNMEDLTKLNVFYINHGDVDQHAFEDFLAGEIGGEHLPVLTFIPLTNFFYPGVMIEIDAFGIRGSTDRVVLPAQRSRFPKAVRKGEIIHVGAISSLNEFGQVAHPGDIVSQSRFTLEQLDDTLSHFGGTRNDIVKINNWYVGGGTASDWAKSAEVRANYYPEPGPVATGLPLAKLYPEGQLIQTDCWIMLGENGETLEKTHSWPEGHWDWPIHLPFKHGLRCGAMVFTGGQVSMNSAGEVVDAFDMRTQTVTSMENIRRVIEPLGAGFSDVIKVNAFYQGTDDPGELHSNLDIRSRYFTSPGPASTGVPLDNLAYEGMLTEFEIIAIVD